MKCGFVWANYRVRYHRCSVADPENVDPKTGELLSYSGQCKDNCKLDGQKTKFRGPGMTECPRCMSMYVKWTNFEEWRNHE